MAKIQGPLLSFGARGQVGKAMVVSKWRGIAYARSYVVPANPRTTAQQANRTRFALLREMYKLAPAVVRAPWDAFAQGRPFLPVNKFVGENNRLLNGKTGFVDAIMSPGARGGLPPQAVVATDGTAPGSIDVAVTIPDVLPDGWTISHVAAAAIIDQDPSGIFSGPFVAGLDETAPYTVNLTGFTTGDAVVAFGWIVYEKPNGDPAYSVSLSDEVTLA
jgi:hypothetical protein